MKIPIFQIDAFTDVPFRGNPAAVCPLDSWLDDETMQQIAAENNLSETAFFVSDGDEFQLRWFTPVSEVDLCGHATLATAYVLFNELGYGSEEIRFNTKSGMLNVSRSSEKKFLMDFPAVEPVAEQGPPVLYQALGLHTGTETYKSDDFMLVLGDEDEVKDLEPNLRMLKEVNARGIIVTAPGKESDFVSRFFAPRHNIDEDPVTGSAHTKLTPYWSDKLGKNELTAIQLSERRGHLTVRMKEKRVEISGAAVRFMKGDITL